MKTMIMIRGYYLSLWTESEVRSPPATPSHINELYLSKSNHPVVVSLLRFASVPCFCSMLTISLAFTLVFDFNCDLL